MWIESDKLNDIRRRLREHPLYGSIRTKDDLRRFTEHHVICVFDFMSLLKSLQVEMSCVRVPWTPPRDAESARWISEIVRDEESDDQGPGGRTMSHFEWYLEAMREIGANTRPIRALVAEIQSGVSLARALRSSTLPDAAIDFGLSTAAVLERPLHVRAAVFCRGREEIIPELFLPVIQGLGAQTCPSLIAYLERHIEIDGDDHGPAAQRMLESVYGSQPRARREGEAAAVAALQARERLWDAITARSALPTG